jgi:diaminopimelate epimerase
MQVDFVKYQGTGNDFILLDDRNLVFQHSPELISKLCDRNFGIGADGLLLLRNCEGFDFEMVYFNSDGSHATFCGNGGRCIVAFASSLGIIGSDCKFKAADGPHSGSILEHSGNISNVRLQMRDAILYENQPSHVYLNSGTYHYIEFHDNPDKLNLVEYARKIRYDKKFEPHGTNVNIVDIKGNELFVRTYEKGVEDETLSCGTGVTASAIAASLRMGGTRWIVHTKGGILEVEFDRQGEHFTQIYLQGPATRVFEGTYNI